MTPVAYRKPLVLSGWILLVATQAVHIGCRSISAKPNSKSDLPTEQFFSETENSNQSSDVAGWIDLTHIIYAEQNTQPTSNQKRVRRVKQAYENLTQDEQQVIQQFFFEDKTSRMIAADRKVPLPEISGILATAIDKLKSDVVTTRPFSLAKMFGPQP